MQPAANKYRTPLHAGNLPDGPLTPRQRLHRLARLTAVYAVDLLCGSICLTLLGYILAYLILPHTGAFP